MSLNKQRLLPGLVIIILITGVLLSFSPAEQVFAAGDLKGKIAYVDVMEIFNVHPQKNSAETKLNELAQNMQSELEDKAKDLPKNEQQAMLREYQNKLNQQEQELIQEVLQEIESVIALVASEKEVRIVLDKKNVIYGGYDLTQDVIDYIRDSLLTTNDSNDQGIIEEQPSGDPAE